MEKQKRVHVGLTTKPCEVCGTDVTRPNSQFRARVFCTRACYWKSDYHGQTVAAANSIRHPDAPVTLSCTHCGTTFKRHRSLATAARPYCSKQCKADHAIANPTRKINSNGYILVWVGLGAPGAAASGDILEHRKVMQEFLGRTLLPEENVHHRNGVRTDNRIENLELWSRSQPPGQRVQDKILWARELLAQYEGLPIAP